jgi:hypothetical protein
MIYHDSLLVQMVRLIDRLPAPSYPERPQGRGQLRVYQEALFIKALVTMTVRRLHRVGELLAVLEGPTQEMRSLRELLCEEGRFPCRRTFERRLRALPDTLPERIGRPSAPWLPTPSRPRSALAADGVALHPPRVGGGPEQSALGIPAHRAEASQRPGVDDGDVVAARAQPGGDL